MSDSWLLFLGVLARNIGPGIVCPSQRIEVKLSKVESSMDEVLKRKIGLPMGTRFFVNGKLCPVSGCLILR